jgi:hypothetical protein
MDTAILNLAAGAGTDQREQALRSEISRQLKNMEDDADLTSAIDFYVSQKWDSLNTRLGLSTVCVAGAVTIIGAAASIKGLEDWQTYFTAVSTILASATTVIGAVLTFLKPSARGARYREFGNKHKALGNRIRIYRTVNMEEDRTPKGLSEKLAAFSAEKDILNSDNPPIPRDAFLIASKEMLEKRERKAKLNGTKSPLIPLDIDSAASSSASRGSAHKASSEPAPVSVSGRA